MEVGTVCDPVEPIRAARGWLDQLTRSIAKGCDVRVCTLRVYDTLIWLPLSGSCKSSTVRIRPSSVSLCFGIHVCCYQKADCLQVASEVFLQLYS
jgi:hypothetical protein